MKKWIQSIDMETGEIMEGVPVWVGRKGGIGQLYGKQWMAMAQDAFLSFATDDELTGKPLKVMLYLFSKLDFENFIQVQQTEIAEVLGMHKPNVTRAIRLLERKGILIPGPKVGRSSSWRLNPNYGYKGDPRGKIIRLRDGSAAFRVMDGGKTEQAKKEKK